MTKPRTRYALEAWFLLPAAYQTAANAKFANYGLGPGTFTVGLSTTGQPPAQAYHAQVALKVSDLKAIRWFADNAPRAWVWVRVRTEYLSSEEARALKALRDAFDLGPYQSLAWQTRDKAFVRISTGPIDVDAALAYLASNATPPVNLQRISTP